MKNVDEPLTPTRLDSCISPSLATKCEEYGIEFVWMTALETSRLVHCLGDAKLYLEFGAGGSTVLAASLFPSLRICSYETSLNLVVALSNLVPSECVHWVNVGEVGQWGYPRAPILSRFHFPRYSTDWLKNKFPDLVLIDGRFRMACFLSVLIEAQRINKTCKILMHDWYRFVDQHGDVLSIFDGLNMMPSLFDDLAEFDLSEIDLSALPVEDMQKLYDEYKYDPR